LFPAIGPRLFTMSLFGSRACVNSERNCFFFFFRDLDILGFPPHLFPQCLPIFFAFPPPRLQPADDAASIFIYRVTSRRRWQSRTFSAWYGLDLYVNFSRLNVPRWGRQNLLFFFPTDIGGALLLFGHPSFPPLIPFGFSLPQLESQQIDFNFYFLGLSSPTPL